MSARTEGGRLPLSTSKRRTPADARQRNPGRINASGQTVGRGWALFAYTTHSYCAESWRAVTTLLSFGRHEPAYRLGVDRWYDSISGRQLAWPALPQSVPS